MKISYNWLKEFVPGIPAPEKVSSILTSVGLEVEDLNKIEKIKGSLRGLIAGEILTCEKHPEADKLKITTVDINYGLPLQIVCGAPNAAVGKKVVVAPVGSTIYPVNGEPVTIKKVKIRGIDSMGMLCAEDEIGIGKSHDGIVILPAGIKTGANVADHFAAGSDWIFEIGITPNRMDAMSHLGVAKDLCAYLSHHDKKEIRVKLPFDDRFHEDKNSLPISVTIENTLACERYAGVSIANIRVKPSPGWIQARLESIGVRPVNNIVDITNYILHETGQPLHAFDADAIKGNKIIVKSLPPGTPFITLDGKERKLDAEDLMICNGADEPMCFGGIFGGLHTGVKETTANIFLESAWFNPVATRKTSTRQGLRTDAAIRFEKGVDISQAVMVLKRAATMIKEIAGGEIASPVTDIYPDPKQRTVVEISDNYLKKISGSSYDRETVKSILYNLDFQIIKEELTGLHLAVPFNKPDINLPADIVEEIMRIDGYDNVRIPSAITISPAIETGAVKTAYNEKTANYLTGAGFSEIFTNSITNSGYYDDATLSRSVKIINSLSEDLDIMRPSLLESGLECIAYNLNRKNNDLLFFEFGNSYSTTQPGRYNEKEHLCLYISGDKNKYSWREKSVKRDFYFIKGICENIFALCGLPDVTYATTKKHHVEYLLTVAVNGQPIGEIGMTGKNILDKFSIKQQVLFADLDWEIILQYSKKVAIEYTEIPRFPPVNRDLSVVVNKKVIYAQIEKCIKDLKITQLRNMRLFDVFESEKLGVDKKALAISFTFTDNEKTLTENEIEDMMSRIIVSFENNLSAEIRK